jgi:carboxylesterase type B
VPSIVGTNTDEGWRFASGVNEASQYEAFVHSKLSMLTEAEFEQLNKLYPPELFSTPQHRAGEAYGDVIFVCPSEQFSKGLTHAPNYRYRFNFTPSLVSGYPLVLHGADVPYVFNQVNALSNGTDTANIVKHFQSYWTNFARTGSPNGAAQQQAVSFQWPLFTNTAKQQLLIEPTLSTEVSGTFRVGHAERCAFWLGVEERLANEITFFA